MSAELERQLREDRILRDAALELVKADISHVKADFSAKSIGSRFATRMSEGAVDVFDEAVEAADSNKGVLTTLIAAIVLWFARNPIMALFSDEEVGDDQTALDAQTDANPHEDSAD
ncbi:hypothetical protein [Pontixanthobacter aquaemixtae]|uniref:Uncharacterized protein n=1 Tax=Pontixanthobacter aquaemixtae TaxID=1958940 RepID=A0A844ZXF2_9SPHN|nr:hypothetical protein [Pontixanthobacter aquaemixtae]MXO90179.1 hypothetical protein [Pontixanthobacter aquaemixtae]